MKTDELPPCLICGEVHHHALSAGYHKQLIEKLKTPVMQYTVYVKPKTEDYWQSFKDFDSKQSYSTIMQSIKANPKKN
jgi:hypothetical protein